MSESRIRHHNFCYVHLFIQDTIQNQIDFQHINGLFTKDAKESSVGADCGEKLYYCTSNSFETRQDHFVCFTSRRKGKEICDTHFIRAVVLEEGTLQHMRLVIQCVADYEEAFRRALGAKRSEEAKKYLYLEKLTPTILNDMVNAVYVHAPDKSSGHRVQDVTISYNYIGILPANLLYDVMNGKAA